MSILQNPILNQNISNLEQNIINKIFFISSAPKSIVNNIYNTWKLAFDELHGDPVLRPQLLEILGTDATELFELNTALTQFMLTNFQGKRDDLVEEINNRLASLPEFIFHEDGTVTVA